MAVTTPQQLALSARGVTSASVARWMQQGLVKDRRGGKSGSGHFHRWEPLDLTATVVMHTLGSEMAPGNIARLQRLASEALYGAGLERVREATYLALWGDRATFVVDDTDLATLTARGVGVVTLVRLVHFPD